MTGVASLVLGTPKHHTAISRHGKTLAKIAVQNSWLAKIEWGMVGLFFFSFTVSSTILLKL